MAIYKKVLLGSVFLSSLLLVHAAEQQFTTPILMVIFKRPVHQERVLDQIRKVRPKKLYIAADGPRSNVASDREKCAQARTIVTKIDWPCEVKTLFSDTNKGPDKTVPNAVSWVLSQEEECIVLEDDCKPAISFFFFCQKMLDYYRNDKHVFHISGNLDSVSIEPIFKASRGPYCFQHYMNCWGWATWRRAWQYYDQDSPRFKELFASIKTENYFCSENVKTIKKMFNLGTKKENFQWDLQWAHVIIARGGWCLTSRTNLVENIGYDQEGTHFVAHKPIKQQDAQEIDWQHLPKLEFGALS